MSALIQFVRNVLFGLFDDATQYYLTDTESEETMSVDIINSERKAEEKERPTWTVNTAEETANIELSKNHILCLLSRLQPTRRRSGGW